MNTKKFSALKVAFAYIGTVVGAGFASGQEILQFFSYFGYWGLVGLLLAAGLFVYFGYLIIKLGAELKADSHLPVIKYAGGEWIGKVIDYVITFFLFGALTVMAAGAGALFSEQLGLPQFLGSALLIGITLGTVLLGLNGVISAISFVVPVLLVSVLAISGYALVSTGIPGGASQAAIRGGNPAVPFWPFSALVYVSYNLILAVAVLAPMGKESAGLNTIRKGALWGGIGLGIGALSIFLAMLANMPQAAKYELPMIFVAGQISPIIKTGYALILFLEIYTTAVGSLYGFSVRFTRPQSKQLKLLAAGAGIAALAAAQLGFTALVRILFPLVGYAGILMLGGLVYQQLKSLGIFKAFIPRPAFKKYEKDRGSRGKDKI
ncbi:MAG: hypothetical protein ACOX4H_04300 [Bacillota bacterium]|nr:hypothetical protein [Clostridia bacterium]